MVYGMLTKGEVAFNIRGTFHEVLDSACKLESLVLTTLGTSDETLSESEKLTPTSGEQMTDLASKLSNPKGESECVMPPLKIGNEFISIGTVPMNGNLVDLRKMK
jgi:hypothetical protein